MTTISKFKCPCCGKETLSEERMNEICEVYGWEDDYVQFIKPDFAGGANYFFLNKYRELYLKGKDVVKIEEEERNKK